MIKDVRNFFWLKKGINGTAVIDIRNLFRLKNKNESVKGRLIRDIRNLSEYEEEDCYKPVRANNIWGNNYIEYESNGDKNKTLSVKKYLNETRLYLKDIINNLKKYGTWKIQSIIAITFIYSKGDDEECDMRPKSNIKEIKINDKWNYWIHF